MRRDGFILGLCLVLILAITACVRKAEDEGATANKAKAANKEASPPAGTSASSNQSKVTPAIPLPEAAPTQPLSNNPISTSKSAAPLVITSIEKSLESYKGKVVILDIWATWCGPCRMEIPGFVRLQEKYRDQGVEIIGLSVDPITTNTGTAVAPFMQQYGINYTVWMINDRNAFGKYPMGQGIPTTYVIDRSGRTRKTYIGARPESQFESDIKELL